MVKLNGQMVMVDFDFVEKGLLAAVAAAAAVVVQILVVVTAVRKIHVHLVEFLH